MNFAFSSNNNIWARFYEFLWWPFWIWLGYFYYDRLIGILRLSFLTAILNCYFRLRTSGWNFISPHWAFAILNRYIFVCLMESHSGCTVHTLTCLSVDLCCITIRDASPTLKQHWFNVLRLKRIATVILFVAFERFQLSIRNTQYWFKTGPPSATLAQNWNIR